ncbi:Wdr78 [Scenedesmus sp. PABB004]|nr:Wdr78 [Scenedesmus sp. PABB004]
MSGGGRRAPGPPSADGSARGVLHSGGGGGGSASRGAAPPAQRTTASNWGGPNRASGVPSARGAAAHAGGGQRRAAPPPDNAARRAAAPRRAGRHSYRQSNVRRSAGSRRTGDTADGGAPIKLIDEAGVNRTPKPLVAIVGSPALRAARGLGTEESVLGSEASDALLGDRPSSAGFSRGWFDSGAATPGGDAEPEPPGARLLVPSNTALFARRGDAGASCCSVGSSARPTRSPPAGAARPAAAPPRRPLSEAELARPVHVLLQVSGDLVALEVPGLALAADTAEGAAVAAANAAYAQAQLAGRDASDHFAASSAQTLAPLRKAREVQSAPASAADAACQASGWDLADSYAALDAAADADAEEALGSVLPSGAAVATGAPGGGHPSSSRVSFMRSSQQNWGRASNLGWSASGGGPGGSAASSRRTTALDSSAAAAWGRPSSSAGGGRGAFGAARSAAAAAAVPVHPARAALTSRPVCPSPRRRRAAAKGSTSGFSSSGGGAASGSSATAAALLAAAAAVPQAEPWTRLPGLAAALALAEAAISQAAHLPQLLLYRDIKLPPPAALPSACGGAAAPDPLDDGLSACGSAVSAGGASQRGGLAVVPPTPTSARPSLASSRGAAADAWAAAGGPGGGLAGGGPGSVTGLAMGRRPSSQLAPEVAAGSRQSSFMGSSRLLRGGRPPPGLQLLWTWSCTATAGMAVTSLAWNGTNTNLVAAGYRPNPAAAATAAATDAARPKSGAAAARQGTDSSSSRGSSAGGRARGAGDGAPPPGAPGCEPGGRVAVWSLKNQFHPVWAFGTKSAVTALDWSRRSPAILGVGLHDGTVAIYDAASRAPEPLLASSAAGGKHSDPVWRVRWLDRGPEREELLVSISTDGCVKAWTIAKGLDHATIMTLKRLPRRTPSASAAPRAAGAAAVVAAPRPGSGGGGSGSSAGGALPAGSGARAAATVGALRSGAGGERDALISRTTGGMALDFSAADPRIYLAGTEDGHIHKCSTSYSEAYLETYAGHIGPVYALAWCPTTPGRFLSASGDWTVRLWQEGRPAPLLTFQSGSEEVLDAAWCPGAPGGTAFGAVTGGGRLELWDYAASTLRPVAQHVAPKCALTALLFAPDAPVVVAASDAGGVLVFRLHNVAASPARVRVKRSVPQPLGLQRREGSTTKMPALPGLAAQARASSAARAGGAPAAAARPAAAAGCRRLTPAAAGKQSAVSSEPRAARRGSPELAEMPARNTTAIGSTIKYRIRPAPRPVAPGAPDAAVADFMTKLKLAWNIFFPDAPAVVRPKEEAKQRLRMILVADRCGMSPAGLTEMKRNILKSIGDFVDIDSEEQIDVSITSDPDVGTVYSVAVPIRRVKPEARLALNADGDIEDLTFEYNPEDVDSDPSARFPYGTVRGRRQQQEQRHPAMGTEAAPPVKVFVSGCYDVLHGGHVEFFRQARALGDHLTVSFASDAVLAAHKGGRRSSIPQAHKASLIGALRMVDAVVIGDGATPGLDFQDHFLRIRPQLLVVTEDDKYGDAKRALCAQVGARYVVLPKDLDYVPTSTTQILANIRAPTRCPLRVDFGGGWLDVPRHARPGGFVVNCTFSPLVSLSDWPFHVGGGLGGSAAHALLTGRDSLASELELGVGWQDPAVIQETGLCVWRSGPRPALEFKTSGDWLRGRMALLWTGAAHDTPSHADRDRDYAAIEAAGRLARDAVAPGVESLAGLAAAVAASHAAQRAEGMAELPLHGEAAKKYCGGGHGGYALYLFDCADARAAFLELPGTVAIEPYVATRCAAC